MGDFIEGPSTNVRIGYSRPTEISTPEVRKTSGMPSVFSVFLLVMLAMIAVITGLHIKQAYDSARFSEAMTGRCFTTAVGARGMVESGDGRTKSLSLIFPSGLRETYPLEGLDEIPCGDLNDAKI